MGERREGREKEGKQGKRNRRRPEELRGPLASKPNHEAQGTPMKGGEKNRYDKSKKN